jgi:protoporphyrinogen oxidase
MARVPNIVILGTGMGGFGAAYRLHAEGIAPTLYDKNSYHGGHTASFLHEGGFLFDSGPHVSFTKDERIQALLAESVDHRYETVQIYLNNFWRGYWPAHPVQLHLHGLPDDLVVKILTEFIEADRAPERPIRTFADWLLASFGRTFAENFPMAYTRKFHLTPAENMSTDWLGPRLYRPSLE